MFEGTGTYLVLCGILVAGLAGAFWFTEVLPGNRRHSGKRKNQSH
ncbi:putative membrane protein [Burkholderia ambifaria]